MTRCRPCAALGISSVNEHGPLPARSRTVASNAGVAAVRLATTSTRVGVEDSIASPFGVVRRWSHAGQAGARWIGRLCRLRVRAPAVRAEGVEGLDDRGVELGAGALADLLRGRLDAPGVLV